VHYFTLTWKTSMKPEKSEERKITDIIGNSRQHENIQVMLLLMLYFLCSLSYHIQLHAL
jgi:hypothetical protein